jgi:hypothetical protein
VQSSYLLEPGADVGQIRLRYNAPLEIEVGGSLRIGYETGQMRESAPVAWQDIKGKRIPVDVTFCLLDSPILNPVVGFALGRYNPAYPLMIDPTLQWHTFMGSSDYDNGRGIAVDGSGNIYVVGTSRANWGTPVNAHVGSYDPFVAKLDSSGSLLWNTFMGATGEDRGYAIAVDGSGNVYVAGYSSATWGAPVNAHSGGVGYDAFATKLDSSGSLLWNTFMGSSSYDYGNAIAADDSGNVYVAGESHATWGTPVNPHAGSSEAFAAKLNSSGSLLWNTFMGSSSYDDGYAITIDSSGNVYVAGYSSDNWGTPVNPAAGSGEAFAAKLNSSGSLLWNTFMGATGEDRGYAIAVDGSGNVYVAGYSSATWGAPVNAHSGGVEEDAFAAKLDSSGSLVWNTFIGSARYYYDGYAIAVDDIGNAYVAGYFEYLPVLNIFATKVDSSGSLLWNACMGSSSYDWGYAIAVDDSGNVYVGGHSLASWGAPLNAHAGDDYDAFVAKIDSDSNGVIKCGGGNSDESGFFIVGCFIATAAR